MCIFRLISILMVLSLSVNAYGDVTYQTVKPSDLQDINSRFFRYINAYIVTSALYNHAVETNKKMGFKCDQEYPIVPGHMNIMQPIVFSSKYIHPISGAWSHRYSVIRCDRKITYNVYVIANNGKKPLIISGLNGDTKVPFADLFNITVDVYNYVNVNYDNCQPGEANSFIENTNVLDGGTKQSWQEVWTVKVCKRQVNLMMDFNEKNGHLNYTIKPYEIKDVKKDASSKPKANS